ncbi:MAG: FtsH protease activity modulator HflK [Mariniblastus sp.]
MDVNDLFDQLRGRDDGGNRRRPPNREQDIKNGVYGGGLLLLIALVGFLCYSSFYRVDASEQGIVLRFGKHHRTVEPGLQMKFPWPIENVFTVPVRRVQSLEFGFTTNSPGRVTAYEPRNASNDEVAEMLTGDLNLAHVEWIVQFKIMNATDSLFNISDESSLVGDFMLNIRKSDINPAIPDVIQDISETVMRKLVGDRSVDSVLTMGREEIAGTAKREIQKMLDEFEAGVEIITVKLQTTSPPELVKDAFQNVNRARQNKERVVNEAEGERNRQIPAARGKRDQLISEAEGYRERTVMEATGSVNAFKAKLAEYEKSPEVTKQRLYLEAMEEVLGQVGAKTIIDQSVNQMLPILNLNQGQPTPNPLRGQK